jgi:hypothetical protein
MVQKAEEVYAADTRYHENGKRGFFEVSIKNDNFEDQWDSSSRPFGQVSMAPEKEGDIVINNGTSFDTTVHGKVAYARRTGTKSGTHYWEVRGTESWWNGALISRDGKCICGFSGLKGYDDVAIARAGIDVYEHLTSTIPESGH